MKACGYCGRQNDDQATHCSECATSFAVDPPGVGLAPVHVPPLAFLITTGLGVLFIALALFFTVGRGMADLGIIPGKPPAGSIYSLITSRRPAPFVALILVYPVFLFCRARFQTARAAGTAGIIVLVVILSLLPRVVPTSIWIWCPPAVLFGHGSGSSFGYYFGAALQAAIGVWLLYWFRQENITDSPTHPLLR